MAPHRRLQVHRGYLTETVYDADLGAFVEAPFMPDDPDPPAADLAGFPTEPAGQLSPEPSQDRMERIPA